MVTFLEYVDKKERESRRHLRILKQVLESAGMKITAHLEDEDPYLFLFCPKADVTFDGVRIYVTGDKMAYRIQKEEKTHPFGRSYPLDIEAMFRDMLADHHEPDKAGQQVAKAIVNEFQRFFERTAVAEKDLRDGEFDKQVDPLNRVILRGSSTGTDYSNMVFQKGN